MDRQRHPFRGEDHAQAVREAARSTLPSLPPADRMGIAVEAAPASSTATYIWLAVGILAVAAAVAAMGGAF